MKQSKYNHFVPVDERLYVLNGLTEKFFSIPPHREETYRELLNNPDLYAKDFAQFFKNMKSYGFVLDDITDEMSLVLEKYNRLRKPWEYSLMVLPTYACNLRCWYCIQDHKNINLSDELLKRLEKHVDKVVKRDDITEFKLWWFGGEPLIQYDKVLSLNLYTKKRCEENGIEFSSNITTNSTLLTPEKVDALRESGVNLYQISIDGSKNVHDKVKMLPGRSAFDHALSIIDYIAKTTHCILRFNYTHETLIPKEVYKDIDERLSTESRNNIQFMIYKVWQEKRDEIDQKKVIELYQMSLAGKIQPKMPQIGLCYAEQSNFFCVFPNGKVNKCDNQGIEDAPGLLGENGDIIWPKELTYEKTAIEHSNSVCRECEYLPTCWGPCIDKRQKLFGTEGPDKCYLHSKDNEMRHALQAFLRNATINS